MTKNTGHSSSSIWEIILFCALILSLAATLLLTRANRDLDRKVRGCLGSKGNDGGLRIGDWVPSSYIKLLSGHLDILGRNRNAGLSLVVILSDACAACRVQLIEWWPRIAAEPELDDTAPTLVFLEEDFQYHADLEPFYALETVGICTESSFERDFRVDGVPLTLLINSLGRVVWLHRGEMEESVFLDLVQQVDFPSTATSK